MNSHQIPRHIKSTNIKVSPKKGKNAFFSTQFITCSIRIGYGYIKIMCYKCKNLKNTHGLRDFFATCLLNLKFNSRYELLKYMTYFKYKL